MPQFWYDGRLVDGKTIALYLDDPGLMYGATAFTTLRVYGSLADPRTNWRRHCDRLRSAIETFEWPQPDWERLQAGAERMAAEYPTLRVALFPDGREWILGRSLPADLDSMQTEGVVAWVADAPHLARSLPTFKTGNYLGAWLALQGAKRVGAKEAILIDGSGNWLETATGNLWGYKNGCWWTPPVGQGILPGLMREQILSVLMRHREKVAQVVWTSEFARDLEAIAYSNSVMELIPVRSIRDGDRVLNFDPHHSSLPRLRSQLQERERS